MEIRVDDEPGRTPRLGIEHPESLGFVAVEADLVREPFGVQAPALDVGPAGETCPEPSEAIELRVLALERDLKMVPRRRFVVGRRGELRVGPGREVVPVRVVRAGRGAVPGGWAVG